MVPSGYECGRLGEHRWSNSPISAARKRMSTTPVAAVV